MLIDFVVVSNGSAGIALHSDLMIDAAHIWTVSFFISFSSSKLGIRCAISSLLIARCLSVSVSASYQVMPVRVNRKSLKRIERLIESFSRRVIRGNERRLKLSSSIITLIRIKLVMRGDRKSRLTDSRENYCKEKLWNKTVSRVVFWYSWRCFAANLKLDSCLCLNQLYHFIVKMWFVFVGIDQVVLLCSCILICIHIRRIQINFDGDKVNE